MTTQALDLKAPEGWWYLWDWWNLSAKVSRCLNPPRLVLPIWALMVVASQDPAWSSCLKGVRGWESGDEKLDIWIPIRPIGSCWNGYFKFIIDEQQKEKGKKKWMIFKKTLWRVWCSRSRNGYIIWVLEISAIWPNFDLIFHPC